MEDRDIDTFASAYERIRKRGLKLKLLNLRVPRAEGPLRHAAAHPT